MISPDFTFEYEAEFTAEGFRGSDIILHGIALNREGTDRLVGYNPLIRFWNDRLVLVASGMPKARVRNASVAIGDAVALSARPGDRLYLVLTGAGGLGLSVLRQEKLVLATGAVTAVPLGIDMQIIRRPESPNAFTDPILNTWLEFRSGNEKVIVRNREATRIGDYDLYVEDCWKDGVPGIDECVSVCVADSAAGKIAAMRSAILLGNAKLLKTTGWDCIENFTKL